MYKRTWMKHHMHHILLISIFRSYLIPTALTPLQQQSAAQGGQQSGTYREFRNKHQASQFSEDTKHSDARPLWISIPCLFILLSFKVLLWLLVRKGLQMTVHKDRRVGSEMLVCQESVKSDMCGITVLWLTTGSVCSYTPSDLAYTSSLTLSL